MNTPKIIAVTDTNAPAGAIIMWALSGTVPHARLEAAWVARGGDAADLPKAPKPRRVLRRALQTLAGKRRLVRPLGEHAERGHALVDERDEGDAGLVHATSASARVEGGALRVEGAGPDLSHAIEARYQAQQGLLLASDIGDWLVQQVPATLDGVALRPKGGVYFVPPHAIERLDMLAATLADVGVARIFRVPAMHSEDAVETILHAVQNEARDGAVALAEALADSVHTTRRGWEARLRDLDALEAKVTRYEALLGASLTTLHEKLTPLRAGLAAAALAADTKSDPDSGGAAGLASLASL